MDYSKYCSFTFNGFLIDRIIPFYQTINVDGRGSAVSTPQVLEIPGRNGSIIQYSTYKSKTIFVHFVVKTKYDKEFRNTLDMLSKYLNVDKSVKFSFGDEEGYRIGRVVNVQNPPFDRNEGVGIIEIYLENPFRIVETKTFTAATQSTINLSIKSILAEYEKFVITPNSAVVKIRNTSTGEVISFNGIIGTNDIVITKDSITQRGLNIINLLDYTVSTWKNFKIKNGDVLQFTGASNVVTTIRGLIP